MQPSLATRAFSASKNTGKKYLDRTHRYPSIMFGKISRATDQHVHIAPSIRECVSGKGSAVSIFFPVSERPVTRERFASNDCRQPLCHCKSACFIAMLLGYPMGKE